MPAEFRTYVRLPTLAPRYDRIVKDPVAYWQREAEKFSSVAEHSAGRVYAVLSFGLGAVSAFVGAGLVTQSAVLLGFAPVAGVFMAALVAASTFESLWASTYQREAEGRARAAIGAKEAHLLPLYGRGPLQPKSLVRLNGATWGVGIGAFVFAMAALVVAALSLNWGAWSVNLTAAGTIAIVGCAVLALVGLILVSVRARGAWVELLAAQSELN